MASIKYSNCSDFVGFHRLVEDAQNDSLVVFDVDDVLIIPTADYDVYNVSHRKDIWREWYLEMEREPLNFLHSIILKDAKWRLVEDDFVRSWDMIKSKKMPSIALTAVGTGRMGHIENRENLRRQQLLSVGIDFLETSPLRGDYIINDIDSDDGPAMLKDGVIFSSTVDKGTALRRILEQQKYVPKSIIFVDDIINNVESVAAMCNDMGIDYHGVEYRGVEKILPINAHKNIEEKRMDILKLNHRWVLDLSNDR